MNRRTEEPYTDDFTDERTITFDSNELTERMTAAEKAGRAPYISSEDDELDALLREAESLINGDMPEESLKPSPDYRLSPEIPAEPRSISRKEPSEKARLAIEENEDKRQRRKKKRIIIIFSAVLVFLALVFAAIMLMKSASEKKEYQGLYNAAQLSFYDGDYDVALEKLREAMSIEKTDDCLLLMSQCYEAKCDYDNAISILESSTTGNNVIAKRIQKLKLAKEEYESGKVVLIAGEQYDKSSTVLDLSNKDLRSGRLTGIGELTELTSLKLAGNSIEEIDFLSPLNKLVSLDLSKNNIRDISPLSSLAELRTLHLDDNANIKDFSPLYRLSNLTMLTISGIEIGESQLEELREKLPNCQIYSDKANADVVEITLGGKTFKSDVKKLDLSGCSITDISQLSVCTQLTELYLGKNYIRDLSPIVDIANLRILDLSNNLISDIRPLMVLSKLEHLSLEGNNISSITPLSEMAVLKELVLNGNKISNTQTLSKLTSLSILGLKNTGILDKDLEYLYNLKNLRELSLVGNAKLSEGAVNKLHDKLNNCKITHSELVKNIELGGKAFAPDSDTVEASALGISDISAVSGFKSVKILDLSGNIISSVSALSTLTTLEYLDLSDNNISDVKPLYSLTNLKQLWIGGNGLSEDAIEELRQALPDCDISVE